MRASRLTSLSNNWPKAICLGNGEGFVPNDGRVDQIQWEGLPVVTIWNGVVRS